MENAIAEALLISFEGLMAVSSESRILKSMERLEKKATNSS